MTSHSRQFDKLQVKKKCLRNNTQSYSVISTYPHTNKPPTPTHKQARHFLMHFTVPRCLSPLFTEDSLHNSSNFLQTRYTNVLWFSNDREIDDKYKQWRVAQNLKSNSLLFSCSQSLNWSRTLLYLKMLTWCTSGLTFPGFMTGTPKMT